MLPLSGIYFEDGIRSPFKARPRSLVATLLRLLRVPSPKMVGGLNCELNEYPNCIWVVVKIMVPFWVP